MLLGTWSPKAGRNNLLNSNVGTEDLFNMHTYPLIDLFAIWAKKKQPCTYMVLWKGHFRYSEVGKRESESSNKRIMWLKSQKIRLVEVLKWGKYRDMEVVVGCCCQETLMCSLLLLFESDTTEWNMFWESKHRWSRRDQCCGAELFLRWDCAFTTSTWFICWFSKLHWSLCVTTAGFSRLLSGLCIINRIAILQWDFNFSILLLGEPKSMLLIGYVNSARTTKMRSANELIRGDQK